MNYYNKIAKYYDKLFRINYEEESRIINKILLKHTKKGRLLDLGCGTGGHIKELNYLGWICDGIDSSKGMIKEAVKKGLSVKKMRMEKIRLPNKYNAITLINRSLLTIKNKKQLRKLIKKITQHLNNNGVILIDLDLHKDYFDTELSVTNYFNEEGIEGAITEEYDKRKEKILWSANYSIKIGEKIIRGAVTNEYLLLSINELKELLNGYKITIYNSKGRETKNYKQPLIIIGKLNNNQKLN